MSNNNNSAGVYYEVVPENEVKAFSLSTPHDWIPVIGRFWLRPVPSPAPSVAGNVEERAKEAAEAYSIEEDDMRDYYEGYLAGAAGAAESEGREDLMNELLDLRRWKEEQCQVLNDLDLQAIGKELKLSPGQNIASKVLPSIKEMRKTIDDWVKEQLRQIRRV